MTNRLLPTSPSSPKVIDPEGGFDQKYKKTCAGCGRTMVHRVSTTNRPIWANQHRWECPRNEKYGGCGNVDAWTEPLESMVAKPEGNVYDVHLQRGPSMAPEKPPTEDTFGTELPDVTKGWVGDSGTGDVFHDGKLVGDRLPQGHPVHFEILKDGTLANPHGLLPRSAGEPEPVDADPMFAQAHKLKGKPGDV